MKPARGLRSTLVRKRAECQEANRSSTQFEFLCSIEATLLLHSTRMRQRPYAANNRTGRDTGRLTTQVALTYATWTYATFPFPVRYLSSTHAKNFHLLIVLVLNPELWPGLERQMENLIVVQRPTN